MAADSVWPPAGAKVRPPWRGKTLVFLFSFSHIPRRSHTFKSRAYDRQQSRGNYPPHLLPRILCFLAFFKRGKIKRHCFTTNLSDDGMFRLVSVLCGWEFIADVFNPKQTECRNGGTQNWGFKCVILLCCLMSC